MCNEWHKNNKYTQFNIDVTYNGWFETSETFFIDQFNTEAILYKDSVAKISDSFKELIKIQNQMSESLNAINEKLNTQDNE